MRGHEKCENRIFSRFFASSRCMSEQPMGARAELAKICVSKNGSPKI